MKSITHVVFDFFDVLHRDYQKAWPTSNGFTRTGAFAEASDLLDLGKITYQEYLERYAQASGKNPSQIAQEFQRFAQLDRAVVKIAHHIKKQGVKIGLLSNASAVEIRPLLAKHKLGKLFDAVIISSEVGLRKPDPAIFQLALKQMLALPARTVFVDDNPHNIQTANHLGIHGIRHTNAESLYRNLTLTGVALAR